MARAVGVGGIFLKRSTRIHCPPGMQNTSASHQTKKHRGPTAAGMTVFAPFPRDTEYFGSGPQQAMVNLRVDNLDEMLALLAAASASIDSKCQDYPYRRFGWSIDPEANRVEVWEPSAPATYVPLA
jgi:hypothetical protein